MNSTSTMKDFEILEQIGKGAFGSVYKVKRKKDSEIYALKMVTVTKLKPKEKENSLNEIRILASVTHSRVISYKEAFYDNNSQSICIVMEFAQLGDLEKKIERNKKKRSYMSETEIINIFSQIIQGLKALHDKKILHRDIKAANIFLFDDDIVKIGDLNVSKVIKMGMLFTQTGTPFYASPEVWNDKPYDYKSDIWSLGCLLYEMTTLEAPFIGKTMDAVYKKVIKGIYNPIPTIYSITLSSMIRNMLQNNPLNRPNCDQLLGLISEKYKSLNLLINPTSLQNNCAAPLSEEMKNKFLKEGNQNSQDKFLLKTIKIPRRMIELNTLLPKSKYKKRLSSSLHPNNPNRANNITSNLTVTEINKTELNQQEQTRPESSVDKNIRDLSLNYQRNDKFLEELLNESKVLTKENNESYVNEHIITNTNENNVRGNDNDITKDIKLKKIDPAIYAINKPIQIKKNIITNNIKLYAPQFNDISNMNNSNINERLLNQEPINENIFELKNNIQEYNSNAHNIYAIDGKNVKNYKHINLHEENLLHPVTPPSLSKNRPISAIPSHPHDRNNSSNLKSIVFPGISNSPNIKINRMDTSTNAKNDVSYINDVTNINDISQSYLPKIQKNEVKEGYQVFNANNINNNAVKLLGNSPKKKSINKNVNIYPVRLQKDPYNFHIKNNLELNAKVEYSRIVTPTRQNRPSTNKEKYLIRELKSNK